MTRLDEQIKKEVRKVTRLNQSDEKKVLKDVGNEFNKSYKKINNILKSFGVYVENKFDGTDYQDDIDQILGSLGDIMEKLEQFQNIYLK